MIKLPNKQELKYKEQDFFISLGEQWKKTKKVWFIILLVVIVLIAPIHFTIKIFVSRSLINSYQPPAVNFDRFSPDDLELAEIGLIRVTPDIFSAYAQLINPNPDLSAHQISYTFVFFDQQGVELGRKSEISFLIASESRFVVEPRVEFPQADDVKLILDEVRWTDRVPKFETDFSA